MPFLSEGLVMIDNIREVSDCFTELKVNFEIVVSSDGAHEEICYRIKEHYKNDKKVIVTGTRQNFGKGFAGGNGGSFDSSGNLNSGNSLKSFFLLKSNNTK